MAVTPESGQTTTDPAPTGSSSNGVRFNPYYFKTPGGIIKIVEAVLGLLCIILGSPGYFGIGTFFVISVVFVFIFTLMWILAYLLSFHEALPVLNTQTEFISTGIAAIWLAVASICVFFSIFSGRYTAGAVFGIINALVYATGAYFLYRGQ